MFSKLHRCSIYMYVHMFVRVHVHPRIVDIDMVSAEFKLVKKVPIISVAISKKKHLIDRAYIYM